MCVIRAQLLSAFFLIETGIMSEGVTRRHLTNLGAVCRNIWILRPVSITQSPSAYWIHAIATDARPTIMAEEMPHAELNVQPSQAR